MVDSTHIQDEIYTEHESELEALKYIYLEDLTILEEKPYKLEILLNSNNEGADKNFIKLRIIIDMGEHYPQQVPGLILKNLSQEIIDNNMMITFERLVNQKAEESIGTMMLYDVCEALREKLQEMNERILNKLAELTEAGSLENALKSYHTASDAPLSFTPVTIESFAKWCDEYKEKMRKMKEEQRNEQDEKFTGRHFFEMSKKIIQEINIDGEDEDEEEFKEEEAGTADDEDEEDFHYDRALYVADAEEEEVDFD